MWRDLEEYYPNLTIFDLGNPQDQSKFYQSYAQVQGNDMPARAVLELLSRGAEGQRVCRSVVLESDYVDRDYAIAYARSYARSFRNFKRKSQRFHFFSHPVRYENLLDGDEQKQQYLQNAYLGYSIIRPTEPPTLGRTVISVLPPSPSVYFPLCKGTFQVNLCGYTLSIEGFPYVEQETRVAACATAAMWMATMAMSQRFSELTRMSMAEITERALGFILGIGGCPIPPLGLTIEQMTIGLNRMGYDTVIYEVSDLIEARDIIYKYIESEMPPILCIRLKRDRHAVTVVGHTYDPTVNPIREGFYRSSEWVPEFIIHDDQLGPYRMMRILPPTGRQKGPQCPISVDISLTASSKAELVTYAREQYEDAELEAVIVPVPQRVFTKAEEAELKALRLIAIAYKAYGVQPIRELVLRTYLIPSNEFKRRLNVTQLHMPEKLVALYRGKPMSRYIWVTEIGERDDRVGREPKDILIRGEVLIDATGSPDALDFIAIHIPGYFISIQPDEDPITALGKAIIVDDGAYMPLVRY